MPNVGGVQYPYTPQGVAAAEQAQRQIQKTGPWPYMPYMPNLAAGLDPARMSPPLTSPSHPMAQRRVPDLQRYNAPPMSTMDIYGALPSAQFMNNLYQYGRGDSPSSPWYQPVAQTPRGRTIETTDPGAGYGQSPSGPTAQMPARQPQSPRQNVTEQFSVPANYGSSPSNPNYQPQSWKDQMLNKLRGIVAIPGQVTQGQSPWQRPITQAPRGQTIRTTDPGAGYGQSPSGPTTQRPRQPANYGRSPSNPNWTPGG